MMARLLVATMLAASMGLSAASLSCVGDDGTMVALPLTFRAFCVPFHDQESVAAALVRPSTGRPCTELACDHMLFYCLPC